MDRGLVGQVDVEHRRQVKLVVGGRVLKGVAVCG